MYFERVCQEEKCDTQKNSQKRGQVQYYTITLL